MLSIHRLMLKMILLLFASCPALAQPIVATQDSPTILAYYAMLFRSYLLQQTVDEMIDSPSNQSSKEIKMVLTEDTSEFENLDRASSRESYLMYAAANADLVVIAEPEQRQSELTQGHYFASSDYVAVVGRVYSSRGVTVLPGQTIVVARPGGIVEYKGKQIVASVHNFPLFDLHERYVMFLRFVPENGSFLVFGSAAFNIDHEPVRVHLRKDAVRDHAQADFLIDVENAVKKISKARAK